MKQETRIIHKLTVDELVKSLGLKGEVVICGFNQHQKASKITERELTIVTVDKKTATKKKTPGKSK